MPRPWGDTAYWLAPNGFLNLLSYTTQSYLPRGNVIPTVVVCHTPITNQENALKTSPNDPSVCQVDKPTRISKKRMDKEPCRRLERALKLSLRWNSSHYSFGSEPTPFIQAPALRSKGSLN